MTLTPSLIALLLLWSALLFGGFLFGRAEADDTRRMPTWTRMVSSFVLVLAAWNHVVLVQGEHDALFALLIALGMTLGFVGDLFMAELLPLGEHVLGGIGAFGLGHLAYIVALIWVGGQLGLNGTVAWWMAWLLWLLVGALGWYIVVFHGQEATFLHRAALPYAMLLASTAGIASGLAGQERAFLLVAIGAALFLLSDLILAAQLFNDARFPLINDLVWLLYGPGQMLIVYGAILSHSSI